MVWFLSKSLMVQKAETETRKKKPQSNLDRIQKMNWTKLQGKASWHLLAMWQLKDDSGRCLLAEDSVCYETKGNILQRCLEGVTK